MTDLTPTCIVLGGGGHARVLIECLDGEEGLLGITDPDERLWGTTLCGIPILGGDELLPELVRNGARSFVVGIGSTRSTGARAALFDLGVSLGLTPRPAVHATACCSRSAVVGQGVQLLPGAIVNAGARLGDNVLINTRAVVEHDCIVGEHAHVATGALLAGGVRVGAHAHIGLGACIREGVEIGAGATVGAGAVVIKDVPPGTTAVGVPARSL